MYWKKIEREGRIINIAVCGRCKKQISCKSMAQQYCDDCKKIVNREKTRLRVAKLRAKMRLKQKESVP